jgi:membrane protein required for colicin V production
MDWNAVWIVDALVLGVILFFFYRGYRSGLISQVVWLGSFLPAFVVASRYSHPVAERVGITLHSREVTAAVAFVLLFLAVIGVIRMLAGWISKALKPTVVGVANSILGGVFSCLIAFVVIMALLNLGEILTGDLQRRFDRTLLTKHVAHVANALIERTSLDDLRDQIDLPEL